MQVLKDQWCLITGAGRGIGAAIAEAMAEAGGNLILVARSEDQLKEVVESCRSKGAPKVEVIPTDLMAGADVDKMAEQALQIAGGRVHVLVNNAGMMGPEEQSPLKGNPDDWEAVIRLNVLAPMRLTRRIAPPMAQAHSGTIINMCSVAGLTPMASTAVYATSKHALRGWSRSSYEELRKEGIKVSTIYPGMVESSMTEKMKEKGAKVERMMKPQDIAKAAMLVVFTSGSAVPEEVVMRPVEPVFG